MTAARFRIAVAKGRLLREALPLLGRAGLAPDGDPLRERRLVMPCTDDGGAEIVIIRAADVPTFVEHGAADFGIAGKDMLMEHAGRGYYELCDLGIARCRMVVAGPARRRAPPRRPRVATKYVATARRHFAQGGRQADIVKLYGSMELAPILGLSDLIVDLVDTGETLRTNGLAEIEEIAAISARLIANRASMRIKGSAMRAVAERFGAAARPE
ncbi:MAG: ATP phosphoribosyltransferase [Gammaproteobacteria bacterium]|nr:ATP phosphoribosyltransferase [Gammaproteobacteria bacterium]